jgi:hypothetical protein
MTALILMRLRVSVRHLVRGHPGENRWVLRAAVLGVLVLLGEVLAFWVASQPPPGGALVGRLSGAAGVVLGVIGGGGIVLLVEASRDQTAAASRASGTLPVSRAQLAILDAAPAVLLTLGLALLTIPPVAGVVRGAGGAMAAALGLAVCAVCLGLVATTIVVVLAAVVMPGPRWAAVRLPVAMLAAGALLVLGVARAVVAVTHAGAAAADEWLVLPALIEAALRGESPPIALVPALAVAALVVTAVLVPFVARRGWGARTAVVRWSWRGRGAPAQLQADALYVLRSPMMIANGLSVLLVMAGAVIGMLTLDRRVADALLGLLVVIGCALAGSVVRLQRGLLPPRRTPQQLVGFTVDAFVASQLAVSMLLLSVLLSPLLGLAIRPPLDMAGFAVRLATGALVAYVVAVLSSWTVPIEAGKGAAQAFAAFVTSVVTVAILGVTTQLPAGSAVAALIAVGGATAVTVLAAGRLEARRWQAGSVQRRGTT